MKVNEDIIYDLLDHLDLLADAFDDFCETLGAEEQENFWDKYNNLKELIEDLNPNLFLT